MSQVLLELFAGGWQVFIHQKFEQEPEVLVAVEADPRQAVIEH